MASGDGGGSGDMQASSTPTTTHYTMGGEDVATSKKHPQRKHRRGGTTASSLTSETSVDDNGSLTYSAGSSIHSSGSATGESTDSSFADIMRVLDIQDSKELAQIIKKEKSNKKQHYNSNNSATSSLNYSTDGESALLSGEQILQTISGQPSDSYGPDGGGLGQLREEEESIHESVVFAAADPLNDNRKASPKHKCRRRKSSKSRSSTPPLPRPDDLDKAIELHEGESQEVWYAKWWMCGFQDAFRDLVPKR